MIKQIANWLENEAAARLKQAVSRRDCAKTMRGTTAKELREAKVIAEKMTGHKLHGAGITVEDAKESARADERIAAKLETEARQLSAWADYLLAMPQPIPAPCEEKSGQAEEERR